MGKKNEMTTGGETTKTADETEFPKSTQPDKSEYEFCSDPRVIERCMKVGKATRVWPG